jgi:hypothetical protein
MPSIATDLLAELASIGVTASVNGNNLRLQPSSLVGTDLRARLKANKPAVVAFLSREKLQTPSGRTDKTAKTTAEEVPSVLSGQAKGVRAKKRGAAPAADTGEFDALEEWARTDPVPARPAEFGITQVLFLPMLDGAKQSGCVGHLSFVLNDLVRISGMKVHRAPHGRVRLAYPTSVGPNHKQMPVLVPLDDLARRAIERVLLDALRGKGYLLAELEPTQDVEAASHVTSVRPIAGEERAP